MNRTPKKSLKKLLLEFIQRANQFSPKSTVSAWIYRIALNLCRDHVKSASYHNQQKTQSLSIETSQVEIPHTVDLPSLAPSPSQEIQVKEILMELEAAIVRLPHELKDAFVLTVIDERSQKESAEILQVTPKAIETRVYRARKWLEMNLSFLKKQ